jgi:hypothetical protein
LKIDFQKSTVANPDFFLDLDLNPDFILRFGLKPDFGFQTQIEIRISDSDPDLIQISDFSSGINPDFGLTSGFDKKHNLNYY